MQEGLNTRRMMTRPVQSAQAGKTGGPAATKVGTDVDMISLTQTTTLTKRMVDVVVQTDAAGPLRGAMAYGPR